MKILAFLLANWDSVLVVLAFLALIVVLIKRGETAVLNRILFGLVTKAEKEFGGGTGKLKACPPCPIGLSENPRGAETAFQRKGY